MVAAKAFYSPGVTENALTLDAGQAERFIRILCESRLIGRHFELLAWLQGEVQRVLPHQILIAAWGDFARWNVKCEVVSVMPGVRSLALGRCPVEDFIRDAYRRWIRGGREPLILEASEAAQKPCNCSLHQAIAAMRSLVVHGVCDKRSGCDSIYLALDSRSCAQAREQPGFVSLVHLLLCQIDVVWRRLAAFRLEDLPAAGGVALTASSLELSLREREILTRIAAGSTNSDIAQSLDISLFTVKNHLKRIFRKIGVSNRTQAAARYQAEAQRAQARNASALVAAATARPAP